MTNAEILMVVFTAVIAVTGALGTITFNNQLGVMQGQLDEMKTASRISEIAAKASKEAADTQREALVKSQRAFVRLAAWPWLWRSDLDRPGKFFFDITPILENAGTTPTADMQVTINTALRDTELPQDFDFPYVAKSSGTLIGPHQTIGLDHAVILDDDLALVQKGKKFFYIWGRATYRDVFSGTAMHTTEFCTQIVRVLGDPHQPSEPGDKKGTTVEITFSIFPRHNRTD